MSAAFGTDGTVQSAEQVHAPSALKRAGTVGIYLALLVAMLYPVAFVTVPPLVDYPAHLATLHILATAGHNPTLGGIYESNWAVLPNLAMQLVALPLAKLFGAYDAGRLFIALTMMSMLTGTMALHGVLHGRLGLWPAFSALAVYNFVLFWGFLNFMFAAGLVLFALAGWIAAERWNPWRRAAAFSLVSVALFFCHLFAFGIYGLCIAAYELWRLRDENPVSRPALLNSWAPAMAQFAVPAALLLLSPTGQGEAVTQYGDLQHKLLAIISPTVFSGDILDRLIAVFVGVLIIKGFRSPSFTRTAKLKYPLLALLVASVLMPKWLLNTWGADIRLPVVLVCLSFAAIRPVRVTPWVGASVAVIGIALFAARIGTTTSNWLRHDREVTEFRQATKAIGRGASLMVATGLPPETLEHKSYSHIAALAVIERSVFLPTLFTDPTRHAIRTTPKYAAMDAVEVTPIPVEILAEVVDPARAEFWDEAKFDRPVNRFWTNWQKRFDYVLVLHTGRLDNPVPRHLDKVAAGSFFDIYKVRR